MNEFSFMSFVKEIRFMFEECSELFCSLRSTLVSPLSISTSSVPESVLAGIGYLTFFAGNNVLLMNSVMVDFPDSFAP